ncbi:ABC transporter ATP-binding protein [Scrofimicrobium sp. R131]|uniref:ABC transporter ATP-binding protein n=1 Tax=Scrofimicrobium appendicitidis TaxID=3079930 RepID=A0AAU7V8M7_9ACTO
MTWSSSTVLRAPQPPGQLSEPVVKARGLRKVYGKGEAAVTALRGVDLEIERSRFTAIMGPSGSGKSTLMHCLAGLDSATSGQVILDGQELTTMSERQLTRVRREHLGFIFQSFNLVPTLTARENITLPADIAGMKLPPGRLDAVVEAVGLGDRLSHRPAELSGGQQQRVACARALVTAPAVVFADEPTGNLDSRSTLHVLQFLRTAVDEFSQTVVMVTHEPDAAAWADRVIFLGDGMVVGELWHPSRDDVLEALRELGEANETGPTPPPKPAHHAAEKAPAPAVFDEADAPRLVPLSENEVETVISDIPTELELARLSLDDIAPPAPLTPKAADVVDQARQILEGLGGSILEEPSERTSGPQSEPERDTL